MPKCKIICYVFANALYFPLKAKGHFWPLNKLVGYVKKPSQWAAQGGEATPCPGGPWGLKLTTHYEGAAGENSTKESFIAKKRKRKKNQTPLLIHYYKLPNALHFALQDCRQLSDQGRRSPAWRLQGLTYSIVFLEKCRWTSHCWMLFSLGLILYVWTQGF